MSITELAAELETNPGRLLRLMTESKLPIESFFTTDFENLTPRGNEIIRWLFAADVLSAKERSIIHGIY